MPPCISVLLPTIRPQLYRRTVDSLAAAADGVSYEVVVIADFGPEPIDPGVWMVRPRQGVISAMTAGTEMAAGAYLFAINDETVLEPGALRVLYEEAEAQPGQVLSPKHVPFWRFEYYGLPFVPFPFVHRDVIAKLGGFLDPRYHAFYADPDLCLRAHEAGVPVRTIDRAVAHHANQHDALHHENVHAYQLTDCATFQSRWAHLGSFYEC